MSVNDACRIIIDDSRVMLQIVASLTNNTRGVIYDCNMFTAQATSCSISITDDRNMFTVQATSLPFPDLRRRREKKSFIIFVKLL